MLARVRSAAVLGIDAYLVDVETDISNGLPSFTTVGLPQGAVKEGRERVCASIANSEFSFPLKRITVNLAPADIRKDGSAFDLPIALGILAATDQLNGESSDKTAGGPTVPRLADYVIVGELGLEGDLRPVRGVLSIALSAKAAGLKGVIVPRSNLAEAGVVRDVEVLGGATLADVAGFFAAGGQLHRADVDTAALFVRRIHDDVDFAEVKGQEHVKRALEIAAAGSHNVMMIGPPGSGKTMLARRLPTVLPEMTIDEALETTKIHSVAGLLRPGSSLVTTRPFRAPHHTISDAGLVGGGSHPRPGEASLAHGGVLFLDELPEFRKNVLEVLRQPMEDGFVTIARAATSLCYPARFMLAAAMNPCKCGFWGDPARACVCGTLEVERYLSRISGPLLDRIDIHIEVPAVPYRELSVNRSGVGSAAIRERVNGARLLQQERFARREGVFANAHMGPRDLNRYCRVSDSADALLKTAISRLKLSARAYHRVLKIARTIADLGNNAAIEAVHVSEAIQYRSLDRPLG
ncbi:MAG: YifB family Mg chelatase-like AAA ATPase [Gemmatimonadota bacterium]|nr:MAG: YifB family Mg chelatase-like AAA ATPase [Gemmatimonadota bacterium]